MKQVFFGLRYIVNYWITGKPGPLICGLVLHNKCNLKCRHCTVIERPNSGITYDEAKEVIDIYYNEGGRCLYLEGGEPLIWKDGLHITEDIVRYAKNKGFYTVIIYTNGTKPLDSSADTIFVSVDGLQKTHDSLRGRSFDRIMGNISKSKHPSIYINYTINTINRYDIKRFCDYTANISEIKGTFFYFHTPYYGYDELYIDPASKKQILYELLELKKNNKILNSVAGLKSAIRNDWKRNLGMCKVYEGGKYFTCCRENNKGKTCPDCGYLSYAEIDQTLKLKPGAMANALKYF